MSDRGRIGMIAVAVVVVGALLFGRFFAGFYTDYLWYDSVGRAGVFSTILRAKLLMFVLFGGTFVGLAVLNLVIADRLAPSAFSANTHPIVERFHEFFGHRLRSFRIGVAVVAGLLFASPAVGHWGDWLMFRNDQRFGIPDAQFGHDVGFYLFRLPFIAFVLDWLFAAVVFITLLVVATHVLSGGILLQPPRPKVRRATKAHIAVLLAVLAVLKAGDYWLTRYELTTDSRGFVRGLLYSAAKAQLPAVMLLALIALLVAGLFLSTLRTNSWRVPVVASALWAVVALVAGVIYPAAIQALVVNANQRGKEAPYLVRNITATRHALGIDSVEKKAVSFGDVTSRTLSADVAPLTNVRLLNPTAMVGRFATDVVKQSGQTVRDLDIDRYPVDGRVQQLVVAARELDLNTVSNKSWQGKHLINTHGCGLVSALASRVVDNVPDYKEVSLARPELYFSDSIDGYAVVATSEQEQPCLNQADAGRYEGKGGILLDSTFKRMAFALSYLDYNMIGSGAIGDSSRLLNIRRVQDRVGKLAPFLSFDGDPYPVALNGRVLWVVDGYTTSDRYPYGEQGDRAQLGPGSGLDHPFNYVRNSVKATVDAYDGTVTLYDVAGDKDPVLAVWRSAFPGLFTPSSQMPQGLAEHLRYPEELFRIQTAAYSKYHQTDQEFFSGTTRWSVAQGPISRPTDTATVGGTTNTVVADNNRSLATESGSARFVPYYSMFRAPDAPPGTPPSFELLRPFVPFSTNDDKRQLNAFMTVSSDPATYGTMTAYTVTPTTDGPFTVANTMNSDETVSGKITLLNREGTVVVYGDLQMVPAAGGLLWVRPVYVQASVAAGEAPQPKVELMLVSFNKRTAVGTTLQDAVVKLFPDFKGDLGGGAVVPPPVAAGNDPTQPAATPAELLLRAETLFAEGDAALKSGDLGLYAIKVKEARGLVQQALDALAKG